MPCLRVWIVTSCFVYSQRIVLFSMICLILDMVHLLKIKMRQPKLPQKTQTPIVAKLT